MITTTFKSNSQEQMDRLINLATMLGIETIHTATLYEDEPHVPCLGEAEADAWLINENGTKYSEAEMVAVVNTHIHKMEKRG